MRVITVTRNVGCSPVPRAGDIIRQVPRSSACIALTEMYLENAFAKLSVSHRTAVLSSLLLLADYGYHGPEHRCRCRLECVVLS
jgi:hypothetical protein